MKDFIGFCSIPDIVLKYSKTANFIQDNFGHTGGACHKHDLGKQDSVNDELFQKNLREAMRSLSDEKLEYLGDCIVRDIYQIVVWFRTAKVSYFHKWLFHRFFKFNNSRGFGK